MIFCVDCQIYRDEKKPKGSNPFGFYYNLEE